MHGILNAIRKHGRWPLAALLTILLAAAITACTEDEDTPAAVSPTPTATATAATSTATPAQAATFPVTITDSRGKQVAIPEAPRRIASMAPSHTEVLFAIGAGDRIVATDKFANYPPEVERIPKLDAFRPSVEAIVATNPDLVVTIYDTAVPEMEALGLTVLVLSAPDSVEGVFEQIRTWGRITGHSQQAEDLVKSMRMRIDALTQKLNDISEGPSVFYELTPDLFTAGPNTFIGDMLRLLKARNIAEGSEGAFPQLTQEVLIDRDPEVILLADSGRYGGETAETVKARPGWSDVSAVKNNRVYEIDSDLVSRPGPRIVEGLEMLARLFYPEKFA
jgi:iron complex transport system substrate-binding protein